MFTTTNQKIKPIQILQDLVDTNKTGNLQVRSNSVTWNISLSKGKLQCAYHSLQSLETIKHCLLRLHLKETAQSLPKTFQGTPNTDRSILSIINQLVEQNILTPVHKKILLKDLSQNTMEFFFWLTEGESQWHPYNSSPSVNNLTTNEDNLLNIPHLLQLFKIRLQAWQQLSPLVRSPYQRPVCPAPSLLKQRIPSGTLSANVLEKLYPLMRGATIRDLGLLLKQNDLRVAQSLFPYIKHKVIVLQLPKYPLDKLPQIPLLPAESQSSTTQINSPRATSITTPVKSQSTTYPAVASRVETVNPTPTKPITSVSSEQKIYKIVSIDDSTTMLDLIKNYLGTEKYEIFTLENPMLSLGYLFDKKPDLILMDFSMPGINGNHLCGILRKSPFFKKTPIIMVSGNLKMIDKDKIQTSGITDCLAKPFTREDLLAIVEKYLKVD